MAVGGGGIGTDGPKRAPAAIELVIQALKSVPGGAADVRAVVNGLFGDALVEQESSLAIPMTFRTASGGELPLDHDGLERALPNAGARLCLLVHGLMSSESVWRFAGRPELTYGELLARQWGVSPVYVRYNTGRHISTNGRELAAGLQRLVRAWPVRVREIDLIGHSMGGLVIRSACHYGRAGATLRDRLRRRGPWPGKVKRVVLLGVPNNGANLEVIANLTSAALWSVPIPLTRLIGAGLDRRSEGIKDLRWGAVLDEDWVERDPDATERPERNRVRVPGHAEYLAIAGSLADQRDTDGPHPVNRLLGDALVTAPSAQGRLGNDEPALFPNATIRLCPKISHIALANRPEVYDEITRWWHATC
ncbi:MAG TPA: alpha/beta fold hydrolase [Acidimicrobiales bacterium]|nr:alpha/beta fold hydrolase [Acidimicrobiales bacterium]